MRAPAPPGLWENFRPELTEGAIYKYEIVGSSGNILPSKPIPTPSSSELRPNTGSVVASLDHHKWTDADWISHARKKLVRIAYRRLRSPSRFPLAPRP